jgi:hypothetical protein
MAPGDGVVGTVMTRVMGEEREEVAGWVVR